MLKFAVGDMVKVINKNHGHGFKIGEIVEIKELYHNGEEEEHYYCENADGKAWYLTDLDLELMRGEMANLQVGDKVEIIQDGKVVAEGRIANINDFREPNMKYAVDVVGYDKDVLFFSEAQLKKK